MHLRAIEAGDRAVWNDLWAAYLAFYETELPPSSYDVTWGRLLEPTEPVWGALAVDDAGVVVGLVQWVFHRTTWSLGDACYLQDLFVTPPARGGGYGRALIEHVATAAREAGAARLYWNTHESNAVARRLYDAVAERSGFIHYRKALPVPVPEPT